VTGWRRRFSFGWEAAGGGNGGAESVPDGDGLKIYDIRLFHYIRPFLSFFADLVIVAQ
jgi:hypothetical protein